MIELAKELTDKRVQLSKYSEDVQLTVFSGSDYCTFEFSVEDTKALHELFGLFLETAERLNDE